MILYILLGLILLKIEASTLMWCLWVVGFWTKLLED